MKNLMRNLQCRKVSRLLWDFSACRLPEETMERIEKHLQRCSSCRKECEQYQSAVDLMQVTRRQPVPDSCVTWYSVRSILEAEAQSRPRATVRTKRTLVPAGAAALALIVPVLAIAFLLPALRPGGTSQETVSPFLGTGDGEAASKRSLAHLAGNILVDTIGNMRTEEPSTPTVRTVSDTTNEDDQPTYRKPRRRFFRTWSRPREQFHVSLASTKMQGDNRDSGMKQVAMLDGGNGSAMQTAQFNFVMTPVSSTEDQQNNYVMDTVSLTPQDTLTAQNSGSTSAQGGATEKAVW